jgi:hypothetical protein
MLRLEDRDFWVSFSCIHPRPRTCMFVNVFYHPSNTSVHSREFAIRKQVQTMWCFMLCSPPVAGSMEDRTFLSYKKHRLTHASEQHQHKCKSSGRMQKKPRVHTSIRHNASGTKPDHMQEQHRPGGWHNEKYVFNFLSHLAAGRRVSPP